MLAESERVTYDARLARAQIVLQVLVVLRRLRSASFVSYMFVFVYVREIVFVC